MNTVRMLLGASLIFVIFTGFICDKNDGPTGTGVAGLSASSSNLTLLVGQERQVAISSGSNPYSLVQNSNTAAVQASLNVELLNITALALGTATITVKDASTPAKEVTITVNVVNSITLSKAGSMSFTMPGGSFSANGILSVGGTFPGGEGAGALQQFNGTALVAYKAYTATKVDLFEADYFYSTSLKTGMYYYPASGNKVQIVYFKDVNPQDTTVEPKIYVFTGATSEVTSATEASFAGTFIGTATNFSNTADKFDVTGGTFNVPMLNVGGNVDRAVTDQTHAMIERLKARYLRKE